jgi:hypothetical protein
MKALGLALFDGAPNPRHRPHADANLVTGSTSLALVGPCAAERRVGIERIGHHPVAHSSRLMVEKNRGDDLEIVIGGESVASILSERVGERS